MKLKKYLTETYKYRVYYTVKGKPFTTDVVVWSDKVDAALKRFYKMGFNFDEVTYAEKVKDKK